TVLVGLWWLWPDERRRTLPQSPRPAGRVPGAGLDAAANAAANADGRPLLHGRAARRGTHTAELFAANAEDREGRNWTYYNYGPFAALDDYRRWVDGPCVDATRLFHAIIDQPSGKAVGVAAYANVVPAYGTIEVGALNFSPRLQRR